MKLKGVADTANYLDCIGEHLFNIACYAAGQRILKRAPPNGLLPISSSAP
jgi:hypothetical protein